MMLQALQEYEDEIQNILDRAVYLAPTTWLNLPGPSFLDPAIQPIKDLELPYLGGNDWIEKRKLICDDPNNEILCAHPFMSASLEQFISVREWELLQQQSEAKRFQTAIKRADHTTIG
jgi:hypothetical protein